MMIALVIPKKNLRSIVLKSFSIPISMLRQYVFCPRIPYYRFLLGQKNRSTLWMQQGEQFQLELEDLLKRRKLTRFGMAGARLEHGIQLESQNLSVHGIVDTLLINETHVVPLEIKLAGGPPVRGQKLQLLAYGLLAAENYHLKFEQGYFLFGKKASHVYVIDNDAGNKADLNRVVSGILEMMGTMTKPDSPASKAQCVQCEHGLECNDRDL